MLFTSPNYQTAPPLQVFGVYPTLVRRNGTIVKIDSLLTNPPTGLPLGIEQRSCRQQFEQTGAFP